MKKTYITPVTCGHAIELQQLMTQSGFEVSSSVEVNDESQVLSRRQSRSLWDDAEEE